MMIAPLIALGADVRQKDSLGRTLLHFAAGFGNHTHQHTYTNFFLVVCILVTIIIFSMMYTILFAFVC